MEEIRLVDVTVDNWEEVCMLYPGAEGRLFVASNSYSICQSIFEEGWMSQGIYLGDTLIGYTLYGVDPGTGHHELCRFMLDEKQQGKGYGKRALQFIIDEMFRRYDCGEIYLSTGPENARGKHVYEAAGFVATGEQDGEGEDVEDIFILKRGAC